MVGGGTVTFVSSSPPLGMDVAKVGYYFFVTFWFKKFRAVNSGRHIFLRLLPLFRPRGLERSSFLDKVMAFSRLTCA